MAFSEEMIQQVWERARVSADREPTVWREDQCGAWIRREHYGRADSEFGWKIESVPQAHSKEVRLWTDRLWRSYTKDEGRPLEVGFQERASNHPKLLRLRAVGGERWGQSVEDCTSSR